MRSARSSLVASGFPNKTSLKDIQIIVVQARGVKELYITRLAVPSSDRPWLRDERPGAAGAETIQTQ